MLNTIIDLMHCYPGHKWIWLSLWLDSQPLGRSAEGPTSPRMPQSPRKCKTLNFRTVYHWCSVCRPWSKCSAGLRTGHGPAHWRYWWDDVRFLFKKRTQWRRGVRKFGGSYLSTSIASCKEDIRLLKWKYLRTIVHKLHMQIPHREQRNWKSFMKWIF